MGLDFTFDTEFLDYGNMLIGISIGIVCVQDGREFYAVNANLPTGLVSKGWLGENVWPYLPQTRDGLHLDVEHDSVRNPVQMAQGLAEFFIPGSHDCEPHRLWAWYGGFDFVILARFCGGFLNMPDAVPQQVRDLKARHLDLGEPRLPEQQTNIHHALHDARWNVAVGQTLGAF